MKSHRRRIRTIVRRLEKKLGPVVPPKQWPVLDELVSTILSQNTTDTNSSAAFAELQRRFPTWEAVLQAPVKKVAAAIRSAGLSNQKAPRIQTILRQIRTDHGELSLEFIKKMKPQDALTYLRKFKGVGPKTAACVLLFACRMPILPVDTHVHRVSQRIGLIGHKTDADRAHAELAQSVPTELVLDFHILLIRHGRTTCMARNPRCLDCVLLDLCVEGRKRLSQFRAFTTES